MSKTLCITRKYPPKVGGMENFSYELFTGIQKIQKDTKIIALGKSQLHLIWFFPYTILYCFFFGRKYDNIIIGDSLLCLLGNIIHFVSPKTKRVIIAYGLDITFKNSLYQTYLKLFYRKSADQYVCISKCTQELIENLYEGLPTSVVTPGIDIRKFEQAKKNTDSFRKNNNIPENDLIIMTCGRLIKRKGVNWFINEVMPDLKDYVTYFVLGDGTDYDLIQESINKNGLSQKVRLCGRVNDDFLNQCYVNSDIFVMPNIHVENDMEGFGIVALEGSLSGNIVLASDIEGIKDAIINEKNGYMLESENAQAFIEKIIDFYSNRTFYKQEAEKFKSFTEQNYSWENVCRKYISYLL